MKCASYSRVSTLLNQDPKTQIQRIEGFIEARGFSLTRNYVDHGISGAKESRPALDQLLKDARLGKFKIVVVTGIDRIGRNVRHLLNLINELNHYGVSIISLRENLDFTTPMGKATLVILGAIAELERELTRERIKTSLAAKKLAAQKSGSEWTCGRPPVVNKEVIDRVLQLRRKGLSIRSIERILKGKVSRSTIFRILKADMGVSKPSASDSP